jgi:hypothetical protein
MTESLRGRLLIGVISLVVVGLLIADIATYTALQSSLISQLDDQVKSGHNAAISGLGGPNEGSSRRAWSSRDRHRQPSCRLCLNRSLERLRKAQPT